MPKASATHLLETYFLIIGGDFGKQRSDFRMHAPEVIMHEYESVELPLTLGFRLGKI